jgi:hypothetical protein
MPGFESVAVCHISANLAFQPRSTFYRKTKQEFLELSKVTSSDASNIPLKKARQGSELQSGKLYSGDSGPIAISLGTELESDSLSSGDLTSCSQLDIDSGADPDLSFGYITDQSDNSEQIHTASFREQLKNWGVLANIPKAHINSLLVLLRDNGHPELPKSATTLLGNKPLQLDCENFYYFGIEESIKKLISDPAFKAIISSWY